MRADPLTAPQPLQGRGMITDTQRRTIVAALELGVSHEAAAIGAGVSKADVEIVWRELRRAAA